jgi:hypothetical protein
MLEPGVCPEQNRGARCVNHSYDLNHTLSSRLPRTDSSLHSLRKPHMAAHSDDSSSSPLPASQSVLSPTYVFAPEHDKLTSAPPPPSSSDQEEQAPPDRGLFNLLESISSPSHHLLPSNVRNAYSHVLHLVRSFLPLFNHSIDYLSVRVVRCCCCLACACACCVE